METEQRWWIYQRERFPVVKHGVLIAVFSSSALGYSWLLRGQAGFPAFPAFLVAFVSVFCFFLQLRIADEFKDFGEDLRYRPYRPVPRGLVTLRELGWLGVASALLQLSLALGLAPPLVGLLVLVWLYFGCMSCEFFVRDWLKAHPVVYLLTHMVIVLLINLYATACDWLVAGVMPPGNLVWFLIASFCNGMVIEIGRKIRAPQDEELGVETYSALWRPRNAGLVWLGVVGLTAIAAGFAAQAIQFTPIFVWIVPGLFLYASWVTGQFLLHPNSHHAKLIEVTSGLWTLGLYLSLGILPVFMRIFLSPA